MIPVIQTVFFVAIMLVTASACTTDQWIAAGCAFEDPSMPRSPDCLAVDRQQDQSAEIRRLDREIESERRKNRDWAEVATKQAQNALGSIANRTWEGRYTCAQGVTAARLETYNVRNNAISGIFYFYPLPENPDAKSGSYYVDITIVLRPIKTGQPDEAREFDVFIRPNGWMKRPDGYTALEMQGWTGSLPETPDETYLSGHIENLGCTGFHLIETAK